MRVEMATDPGSSDSPNEDFVSVSLPASGQGGVLVVLDGVTPPRGDYGCMHGVSWYSARLGGALLELSGSRQDMTLTQCFADAITRVAAGHEATCDLSHPRTPQATVVLARWSEDVVEHLVLSDSALLIESPEGAVTPLLDQRLDDLRPAVLGLPRAERAARIEALRNVEGGFFTAAADPSVADRAVTGSTARARVRTLAGLTDGVARWVEVFRLGDWTKLCALLRKEGPEEVISRVRAAERDDPEGVTHPRGKPRDDAAAVLVEL
jgi:Protein phosphatase 2C